MNADFEPMAFAAELNQETPRVDLHGMRADMAVHTLDAAINHEFIVGTDAIRIIHGRGDGILRRAVQDHLQTQTQLVAYFRDSTAPGEHGGATIAVLHKRR